MDSHQDTMTPEMATRRQSVLHSISAIQGRGLDELTVLLDWAREESIKRLVSGGCGPALNAEYFQWYIDTVMWDSAARERVLPYAGSVPDAYGGFKSVEYREGYDRYQHLAPPPRNPPKKQKVAHNSETLELYRAPVNPQSTAPSAGNAQQQPQQGQHPSARTEAPLPTRQPRSTVAPGGTSSEGYMWPPEEAEVVWQKVYPGRATFRGGGCFRMRFPPQRDPLDCINWRMSRANQILGGHSFYIVWDKTCNRHSSSTEWHIVLSPLSRDVNLDDDLVLDQLTRAWDKIVHWYEQMVTQDRDINLADMLEKMLHQNMEDHAAFDAANIHNFTVKMVNRWL
ncbi:hypothetical protein F4775DRAFT_591713 [Biscogniauxia sp. FL1348]|nr:hypothetical protein F4775DRAFT_591713 [Biscogniauxia sp. FL1348]